MTSPAAPRNRRATGRRATSRTTATFCDRVSSVLTARLDSAIARCSGVRAGLRLAVAAEAEQLEPVGVDPVTAPPRDLRHRVCDAAILHFGRAAAARADDVVMVRSGARDVRMLAVREVQALDDVELGEEFEHTEERCPADPEATLASDCFEFGGREVTIVLGDQFGEGTSRSRQPVAAGVERLDDRVGWVHAARIGDVTPRCRE
jgi:hypothetical protein